MADSQEERLKRDEQIRETIMAKLVESGEKDKLKEMLRERLVQCGWRDELKEHCKEIIRRKGLEKVTVEELVAEITPHGRCKKIPLSQFELPLLIVSLFRSYCSRRCKSRAIEENSVILAINII